MILSLLFQSPITFFAWITAIFIALSVHEYSHAAMANFLGDPTAKNYGRLTLNPFAHLDFLGTMLLLLVGFGWGKPVPFNPYNLRNRRFGPALVAIAGPFANFVSIIFFGLILRFVFPLTRLGPENALATLLSLLVIINSVLMIFNLIPIPPLDGSRVLFAFLPARLEHLKISLARMGPMLLLFLIIMDSFSGGLVLGNLFRFILGLVAQLFGAGF